MNTLHLTHSHGFLPTVFNAFENGVAYVRKELMVHAAIRELRQLDDRSLADIGITRADIARAVRGQKTAK